MPSALWLPVHKFSESGFRITGVAMLIVDLKSQNQSFGIPSSCKTLKSGMAQYPIRRVVCKTFTIPTGYLDVSQENCLTVNYPRISRDD